MCLPRRSTVTGHRAGKMGCPDVFSVRHFSHGDLETDPPLGRQPSQIVPADGRQGIQHQHVQSRLGRDKIRQRTGVPIRQLHQRMLDADIIHPDHDLDDHPPLGGQVEQFGSQGIIQPVPVIARMQPDSRHLVIVDTAEEIINESTCAQSRCHQFNVS